jgi:hypothetical protein
LQTRINFWKENSIDSYHQKAATHFDEFALPNKEAAKLFECDSDSVAPHHAYLALRLATLILK